MDVIRTFISDSGNIDYNNRAIENFIDLHNKKGYIVKSMSQNVGTGQYSDKMDKVIITVHMSKNKAKGIV